MSTVAELVEQLTEKLTEIVRAEVMDEVRAEIKPLAEAIAKLSANDPVKPEEPKPVYPVEPAPEEPPIAAQSFAFVDNNTGEWRKGVSTSQARFFLVDTSAARAAVVPGRELAFSNGQNRKIISAERIYNNLLVTVEGAKLDVSVGHPNKVQVHTKGGAVAPVPKPEPAPQPAPEPSPNKGDLPIAGMCVAGLGNNPWLASINGLGKDQIGTHYRDVEEKTILEFVKDLKPGESWIARIDIALERFIDSSNMPLNEKYVKEVLRAMDLLHKHKGRVILDVHNYMRYWKKVPAPIASRYVESVNNHLGKGHAVWTIIGATDCPITVAGFADFWRRMAETFGKHPALLGYGLSNEPHTHKYDNMSVHGAWPLVAQVCINAIRPVDKDTFIMVGGNFWSSAKLWATESAALGNLTDPSNKLVFEAHQYMDKKGDGGGRWDSQTDPVAADQGVKDFARWFKWLEDGNRMGYCGEVGGPATAGDLNKALENLYAEFYKRRIPWTQWRAGAGFGDNYANGMNRENGSLKDNAQPLMKYLGKTVESYGPRR